MTEIFGMDPAGGFAMAEIDGDRIRFNATKSNIEAYTDHLVSMMATMLEEDIRECLGKWVSGIEPVLKYDATTLEFLGVGIEEGGVIIPARQRFIEAFPIGHRPNALHGLALSKSRSPASRHGS